MPVFDCALCLSSQLCDLVGELGTLLDEHVHILVPALATIVGNADEVSFEHLIRTALDAHNAPVPSSNSNSIAPIPVATGQTISGSGAAGTVNSSCSPESVELTATSPQQDLDVSSSSFVIGSPVESLTPIDPRPGNGLSRPGIGIKGAPLPPAVIGSIQVRLAALKCLVKLTDVLYLEVMATTIVHPLCRILTALAERVQTSVEVKGKPSGAQLALQALFTPCMDVIANLVVKMGPGFKLILPLVQVTLTVVNMSHTKFNSVLSQVSEFLLP